MIDVYRLGLTLIAVMIISATTGVPVGLGYTLKGLYERTPPRAKRNTRC